MNHGTIYVNPSTSAVSLFFLNSSASLIAIASPYCLLGPLDGIPFLKTKLL